MRIRDITEAPIEDFSLIGDFSKGYSMRSKTDRRLLSNPRYVERIKNMFRNTEVDFRMFFVNMPGAEQYIEMGLVEPSYIQQEMPEVYDQIMQQGGFSPNSVNIVYTNNQGAERRPMTGWIIAHRAGHAILRTQTGRNESFYRMLEKFLIDKINYAMQMYGAAIPNRRYGDYNFGMRNSKEPNYDSKLVRSFLAKIGTFRSARENNMRTMAEFIYECFAQYLFKGEITFNQAPSQIQTGTAWGRPQMSYKFGQPEQSEADTAFETVKYELEQEFSRVLHMSVGKVFLM